MPVPIPSDHLILSLSKDERNGLSFDELRMRPFRKTFPRAG
jgi:hypothetical protein